ncbi:hypothetical protein [Glycomyces sp. MUSA5-2]|uniref:hypothetical protein n=1 Tax=Glycomyces sp. MUSA5-2 TaxID=2053002 RepID=UPI0030086D9C
MNGDIEALLRSGLAEQAERAPEAADDAGLADLAIAGAHRIRRRRRIGAAAGGAGLLVIGAGVFALQPLLDMEDQGTIAADSTSTAEARGEFDMEFVIDTGGEYAILNQDGDTVPIGDTEPDSVYRLQDGYVLSSSSQQTTGVVSLDGSMSSSADWPSPDTYTTVNVDATGYAMVTPDADLTFELYTLNDVAADAVAEPTSFSVSYDLTLANWNTSTAVFTADLWSTTGGGESTYYFNSEYDWNLAALADAGFESVAVVDATNTDYVCVADLDANGGVAREGEECGPVGTERIKADIEATSQDDSAVALVDDTVDHFQSTVYYPMSELDLGEYEDEYYSSSMMFIDPFNRWEMSYNRGDTTWLMIDYSEDPAYMTILSPPSGAVMPVMDYIPPE